jgi:dihydrofolate reductase
MSLPVAMIAAVARNGVIGAADGMPWYLPSDFAHFKRTTMGKPIVMGRKTFESIGKPLPGRANIVVTRQPGYAPDGVTVADSLAAALELAEIAAQASGANEIVIGGGGEIYREAMPLADRLYITHVDAAPPGDTTFPPIEPGLWEVVAAPAVLADPRDTASYRVNVYARRRTRQR